MAIFKVSKYYVEWCVCKNGNGTGTGKFVFRSEGEKASEYKESSINCLSASDFQSLLMLIQTLNTLSKPIYWDTERNCLRNDEIMMT